MEAVLNSAQAVVAGYRYDPFGNLTAKTGSLTQPYLFSTKRYDAYTGLYDFGFRFYSPLMDRWTTRDPLGEEGGLNLYAFVGNNPVNWVDPWGLTGIETAAAIGTGIAAWCARDPVSCERAVAAGLAVVSVALIHLADIPIVYRTPPIDVLPLSTPPTEGGDVCEAPPVVPYLPYFPSPDTWTATTQVPTPLPPVGGRPSGCEKPCSKCIQAVVKNAPSAMFWCPVCAACVKIRTPL